MQLTPPVLQVVPRSERLTYKVSVDGALLLKQGRFMKRYTGNKHVEIDINGKVWLNPKGLKIAIASAKEDKPKKKKPTVETAGFQAFTSCEENQNSDNLSTLQSGLLTDINDLSTKPAKKYSVNKKEVPRRIMAMLNSQMGHRELYFITVSFPPVVTDALGMQLLNTWLTSLRKYRMIRQYIWVAERQQVGTIHFHICVPHFLNIHRANRMMAGCLKELHKKGSIHYPAFAKYNGVDIAGTRPGGKGSKKQVTNFAGKQKAKALGWYLTKYITKNATEFDQLAWHNSRGYSALHHGITLTDAEFEDVLQYHLQLNEFKIFERDFFCWAPWARGKPPDAIQLELFKVNSYTQWLLGYCHPKDDGVLTYTEPVTSTVRNPSTEIPNNTKKINDMRFGDSKNKDMRLFPLCIGRECVLVRRSRVAAFIEQVQKYDQLCAVLYYDVSINASLYSIIDLTGQGCLPTMEYWECSVRAVEGVLPWPLYFSDIFFIGEKPLPWESEASADQRIRNYKTTNKMITDLQLSLFNKFSSAQQYSYTPEYLDYCIAKFIALPLPGGLYTDRFKVSHAAHLAEIKKEIAGNNFELAMQRMAYAVAWYLQLPNL